MLAIQLRLTTNPLTVGGGTGFELDEIYVPLGLVERKEQSRLNLDQVSHGKSNLDAPANEVVTHTFQHDEFLDQVLGQGQSPKSHGRRIAIIGEPGSGKTTLLQRIAQWVIEEGQGIPIWVSLADLQDKRLEAFLLEDWLKAATKRPRVTGELEEAIVELFNHRKVWLLLDGVDELGVESGNPLSTIARQLSGWVADARVVLTCRLNVWDAGKNALEIFDTYRSLEFRPDQVGQFIGKWFSRSPDLEQRLPLELDQPGKEQIRDMIRNPLRLALLCYHWQLRQGGSPATKAALYERFVEALYEWKQESFSTTSAERQALNAALGELAYQALNQNESRSRLRDRFVRGILGERDTPLFQLALRLGWLNQVGVAAENPDERVYAFFHPTFQEYFAARATRDWREFLQHNVHSPTEGTYRVFEPRWKEAILLWLGREDVSNPQKAEFIRALVNFKDQCENFYKFRAYFLCHRGIAAASPLRSSPDQCLIHILEDVSVGTRNQDAIKVLTDLLAPTQDEIIRVSSARSLANVDPGNVVATQTLIELLRTCQSEQSRRKETPFWAAMALENLGLSSEDAVNILVDLLQPMRDRDTRAAAISRLYHVGTNHPQAVKVLVEVLRTSQDEQLLEAAANALAQIGTGNPDAVNAICELLRTEKYNVCSGVVQHLEKIGIDNPIIIEALVELLRSIGDKDGFAYEMTVRTLCEIAQGDLPTIGALVDLLRHTSNERIRQETAWGLREIATGNRDAAQALIDVLLSAQDKDTITRAGMGLEALLSKELFSFAITGLKDWMQKHTQRDDPERYRRCFNILWKCAQNLSYPDFYQAWHSVSVAP